MATSYTSKGENGDVVLSNPVPEAEYMYGCLPTAVGMILGYYDLYGYRGTSLSAIIDGDVALKSRATDGNKYNMNAFDTVLGNAIASQEYVYRFFSRDGIDAVIAGNYTPTTSQEELEYSFVGDGDAMNTADWNCLADYLGTGQYWRGNSNYSTTNSLTTLEYLLNYNFRISISDEYTTKTIDYRNTSMLYGLDLYVKSKGLALDYEITGAYIADVAGGDFTFEDYMAEIDAGRPVIVSITGHAMTGYGYNAATREIIFDDCYSSGQKMAWDGTYHYSGAYRGLESITVIGFNVNGDVDLQVVPAGFRTRQLVLSTTENGPSTEYCFENDRVYLAYCVKNAGTKESGAFAIGVYVDDSLVSYFSNRSLDPNGSRTLTDAALSGPAVIPVGLHEVKVAADVWNAVQELSGSNNQADASILVLKSGTNVVSYRKNVSNWQTSYDDFVSGGARISVTSGRAYDTVLMGSIISSSSKGVSFYTASATVAQEGYLYDPTVYRFAHVYVQSGGTAVNARVESSGALTAMEGGLVSGADVSSRASMTILDGARLTGQVNLDSGASAVIQSAATLDFDISELAPGAGARVNNLSRLSGAPIYTLTVAAAQKGGSYTLAEGASGFSDSIGVCDVSGGSLGLLTVGGTANIGGVDYSLNLNDDVLSVSVAAAVAAPASSDIDGTGVSDVMFVWTGEHGEGNYQHGYWMNGTNAWQSQNGGHPAEWDNLGCHDMTGDGKAESVLVGNVVVDGVKGAYIGYYADAIDKPDGSTWVNIGYLTNSDNIVWKKAVGNLTGNASGANSIVWHAPQLGALGAWTDGTDTWVSVGGGYDANWTMIGCGDFDGDGADDVLMSYNGGRKYYAVALDGSASELAVSDTGWEVRAIGDFSGDGRDDVVAFHLETGLVAKWADGDSSNWSQLGQLDAKDWFVVGCGDYDGDAKDDLLVRQYSTGMLGYYSAGDMSAWNVMGYGVDMSWTVIA